MASLDNVSGKDKVFRDGAARDKPRLVWVDQKGDKDTESEGKTFGENFETAILKRDGAEIVGAVGAGFFWEENNVRLIYRRTMRHLSVQLD
jgi:hypothetical protein